MTRIGKVANGESNFLEILVVDGKTGKQGSVVEIGGCGIADVHRLGDAFVIAEHYTGENDAASEAALDYAIGAHPTTRPHRVGSVKITSGELALVGVLDVGTKRACRIKVPAGTYDVWREDFGPGLRGSFGVIDSRVRIVPAGTRVVKGEPIVAMAAPKPRGATDGDRRLVDGWSAIKSLALASDGRLFAGENGGYRIAAWNADGTQAWDRELVKPNKKNRSSFREMWIQLQGDDLFVMARDLNEVTALHVLDPATGRTRKTLKIPSASAYRIDGDRLLLAADDTRVLSYPKLAERAHFEEYTSKLQLAVSPDGKWLAASGLGCHVYDFKKLAFAHTIETPAHPYGLAFTEDNKLVIGEVAGHVGIYDPKGGKRLARLDAAGDRKRKPSIIAIATSAKHIAAGRDDGTVTLIELAKPRVVKRFENHTATNASLGTNPLDGLAFTADGATLWVTGTPKRKPVGLTGYAI